MISPLGPIARMWEPPMRRRLILVITFACCGFGSSLADVVGASSVPTFTLEDQLAVERNAALATLVELDPRDVRRALDMLANASGMSARSADQPAGTQGIRK